MYHGVFTEWRPSLPGVFFWFIGTAVVAIWFVFTDPAFDYRLLVVGSVLPAVVDAFFGGARVLHSVTFSVLLLAVLMLATPGRKPIRRMLLGLPLGTMLHLVFTGAWTNSTVFWWPFLGLDFDGAPSPGRRPGLVERAARVDRRRSVLVDRATGAAPRPRAAGVVPAHRATRAPHTVIRRSVVH